MSWKSRNCSSSSSEVKILLHSATSRSGGFGCRTFLLSAALRLRDITSTKALTLGEHENRVQLRLHPFLNRLRITTDYVMTARPFSLDFSSNTNSGYIGTVIF